MNPLCPACCASWPVSALSRLSGVPTLGGLIEKVWTRCDPPVLRVSHDTPRFILAAEQDTKDKYITQHTSTHSHYTFTAPPLDTMRAMDTHTQQQLEGYKRIARCTQTTGRVFREAHAGDSDLVRGRNQAGNLEVVRWMLLANRCELGLTRVGSEGGACSMCTILSQLALQ